MKRLTWLTVGALFSNGMIFAQADFAISGTPIPQDLMQQNYGIVSKSVSAFDLNICNVTAEKESIVSSKIYQAFSKTNASLQPIGRDIMLAAIIRGQNRSKTNVASVALNSITGLLTVLSATRFRLPAEFLTGAAIGSVVGQQILSTLKPLLSPDQLEKFESQVLEPALVLDGGSCAERTVFVINIVKPAARAKLDGLSFHIH